LLSFLRKWLLPNSVDLWVWLWCLAIIWALLLPWLPLIPLDVCLALNPSQERAWILLWGSVLALISSWALTVGLAPGSFAKQLNRRWGALLSLSLLSLLMVGCWAYAVQESAYHRASHNHADLFYDFSFLEFKADPLRWGTPTGWLGVGLSLLLVPCLGLLLPRIVRWWISNGWKRKFKPLLSRGQVLIACTLFFFALSIAIKINPIRLTLIDPLEGWGKLNSLFSKGMVFSYVTVCCFFLPAIIFTQIRSLGKRFLFFCLAIVGWVVVFYQVNASWLEILLFPFSSVVFLMFGLMILAYHPIEESAGDRPLPRKFPSVGAVIPMGLLVSWLCIYSVFDLPHLFSGVLRFDWQEAREVKQFKHQTGGKLRRSILPGWGNLDYFSLVGIESSDELDRFLQNAGRYGFIERIEPDFDTTPLAGRYSLLTIKSGEVRSEQLQDLALNANFVTLHDLMVIDPQQSLVLSKSDLKIVVSDGKEIGSLLRALDLSYPPRNLSIKFRSPATRMLTQDEAQAMIQVAEKMPIFLPAEMAVQIPDGLKLGRSAKKFYLSDFPSSSEVVQYFKRLDQKFPGADFTFDIGDKSWESFEELLIAKRGEWVFQPNRFSLQFEFDPQADGDEQQQLLRWIDRFRLAYEVNEQGLIRKLFFPYQESVNIPQAGFALESLSYDCNWLARDPDATRGIRLLQNFDFLKKHSGLKELHLSVEYDVEDLGFLQSLPDLEILTICLGFGYQGDSTGFEVCKNLKRLHLYGRPDAEVVAQLQTLEKLKTIVLRNRHLWAISEENLNELQAKLPAVEIKVLDFADPFPIPDDFIQHAKQVRQELSEKYRKDDPPAN